MIQSYVNQLMKLNTIFAAKNSLLFKINKIHLIVVFGKKPFCQWKITAIVLVFMVKQFWSMQPPLSVDIDSLQHLHYVCTLIMPPPNGLEAYMFFVQSVCPSISVSLTFFFVTITNDSLDGFSGYCRDIISIPWKDADKLSKSCDPRWLPERNVNTKSKRVHHFVLDWAIDFKFFCWPLEVTTQHMKLLEIAENGRKLLKTARNCRNGQKLP